MHLRFAYVHTYAVFILGLSPIYLPSILNTVGYRPVADLWLCKQRPLLVNARNIHARNNRRTVFSVVHPATVSAQRLGKHMPVATDTNSTIEERCFLCGPCRDISKGQSWLSQFSSIRETVKKRVSFKSAAVKGRCFMWYLERVIQWGCYSSCIKIRYQETANGDCNRLRTLVYVSQGSVSGQ
jgi:hypothetical protein